jgi:hypothetical protein
LRAQPVAVIVCYRAPISNAKRTAVIILAMRPSDFSLTHIKIEFQEVTLMAHLASYFTDGWKRTANGLECKSLHVRTTDPSGLLKIPLIFLFFYEITP